VNKWNMITIRLFAGLVAIACLVFCKTSVAAGDPLSTTSFLSAADDDQLASQELIFHITDFGINQPWSQNTKTGDPFNGSLNRVYPELDNKPGAQIVVQMPEDSELDRVDQKHWADLIASTLVDKVRTARSQGTTEFEIQIVENMRWGAYALPSQQNRVAKFANAVYAAIGSLITQQRASVRGISVDVTAGSNGTEAFTHSRSSWESYRDDIHSVSLIDGRAFYEPTKQAIQLLGASKVFISVSYGDMPANDFSIANLSTVQRLVGDNPGLKVALLEPLDAQKHFFGDAAAPVTPMSSHVLSMVSPDAKFLVSSVSANGVRAIGEFTSRDLRTPSQIWSVTPKMSTSDQASKPTANVIADTGYHPLSAEDIKTLQEHIESLNKMVSLAYDIAEKVGDVKTPLQVKFLPFVAPALGDIYSASQGKLTFWNSQEWKEFRDVAIDKLPEIAEKLEKDGILPPETAAHLAPFTAGLANFIDAAWPQIQRGTWQPSVAELTHYIDGTMETAAAIVGSSVGGVQGAKIASGAYDVYIDVSRGLTYPAYQAAANDPVRTAIIEQYDTYLAACLGHHTTAKSFEEYASDQQSLFTKDEKAQLDGAAYAVNASNARSTSPPSGGNGGGEDDATAGEKTASSSHLIPQVPQIPFKDIKPERPDEIKKKKPEIDSRPWEPPSPQPVVVGGAAESERGGAGVADGGDDRGIGSRTRQVAMASSTDGQDAGQPEVITGDGYTIVVFRKAGQIASFALFVEVNGKRVRVQLSPETYGVIIKTLRDGKSVQLQTVRIGNVTRVIVLIDGQPVWEIHYDSNGRPIWQGPAKSTRTGIAIDAPQRIYSPAIPLAQDPMKRGGVLLRADVITNGPPNLHGVFGGADQKDKSNE